VPILAILAGLILAAAAAAAFWRGAARRAWFWVVAMVPAALFLLLNVPYIPFALAHPADPAGFGAAVLTVAAVGVVVFAGVRTFLDVRRGAVVAVKQTARTRGAVIATALIAVVAGALLTSIAASAASAAGSIREADSVALLQARDTRYIETSIDAPAGKPLALVVVNRDSYAHSFDVDGLELHVQLPPNSSTPVLVALPTSGSVTFYCAIPGHAEAGMKGTIVAR
jgi:uncharacterized cupredoxin-like copper-binding protein